MSKTPLNELLERIDAAVSDLTGVDYPLEIIKGIITELLPTEREVIEEAWDTGKVDGKDMGYNGRAEHTSAQHYFTQKFNNNGIYKMGEN